jgi:hypothetical protein
MVLPPTILKLARASGGRTAKAVFPRAFHGRFSIHGNASKSFMSSPALSFMV